MGQFGNAFFALLKIVEVRNFDDFGRRILKKSVVLHHEKHHELGAFYHPHPHLGQFFYIDERRT